MLSKTFWKSLQVVDQENAKNIRLRRRTFLWHQKWCHSPSQPLKVASKLMPHSRNARFLLSRLRNGANFLNGSPRGSDSEPISRKISSYTPTATFEPPKRHLFSKLLKIFCSVLFAGKGSLCLLDLSIPLQHHGGQKNDILFLTFWKSFSIPIPHGFEAKSKHRAEAFSFYSCTATSKAKK